MGVNTAAVAECVAALRSDPSLLHSPELHDLRAYMEELGATIPPVTGDPTKDDPMAGTEEGPAADDDAAKPDEESEEEPEEPEPVISDPDVIEDPDPEPHAAMGDSTTVDAELSEAQIDEQMQLKSAAQELMAAGDTQGAIDKFTAALLIKASPLTYAKRASLFLQLGKPKAAIRDCDAAIALNPDSAKSLKVRGAAHRALGSWEQAAHDLQEGNRIDFDEEAYETQKLVESHWNVIREYRLRKEAKDREREKKERLKRAQEIAAARREAAERAAEEEAEATAAGGPFAGMNLPPDVAAKMADPVIAAKLQKMMSDLQTNPMEAMKYMSDPDLQPILASLQQSMGGIGGMPGGMGGMPGGMGGMPGGMGGMGGMPGMGQGAAPTDFPPPKGPSASVEEVD